MRARASGWSGCGGRTARAARRATTSRTDTLIAVGRLRPGPEAALFERYNARLRPPLAVREVAEGAGDPGVARQREAMAILGALPVGVVVVALDEGGSAPGSQGLADWSGRWAAAARPVWFVIGGAEGLGSAVLDRADERLSLGPFTWPHLLVRGLLAEQLYRAQCIVAGHPYHRGRRA